MATCVILLFAVFLVYQLEKKEAEALSYEDCRKILASVEASRAYVRDVLRPTAAGLVEKGEFIPEMMSASFVARSQFEKFLEYYPDYYVKFASLNPRNPKNLAGPEEARVLRDFQNDPDLTEWQGEITRDGKKYITIAKPFRFKKGCIRCHGKPEDAPQSLRLRYGDTNGFGLQVGDLTMFSVGVPIQTAHSVIKNHFSEMIIPIIFVLASIIFSTALLFKRLVSEPLNTLKLSTKKVVAGNYNKHISLGQSEEFTDLATAFNKMAFTLQNNMERTQKSESSLEEAQRLARIGSWSWNVETDTVQWSNELYKIAGWDPEKPPPTFEEQSLLYTNESWKLLKIAMDRAVNNGDSYDLELQMVHPNGQLLFTSTRGIAETDESGSVVRLYGTVQDITEPKKAKEALMQSERMFRDLYAQSPVGIETYDLEGRLIDVNPACMEIFGIDSVDEVREFQLFEDPNIPDDAKERLRNGEPVKFLSVFDFNIVKEKSLYTTSKSGISYLECFILPIETSNVERSGFFVYVLDITDRKRAEVALKKAHDDLELRVDERTLELKKTHEQLVHSEKLSAIGGLSASIAHEFNNPLQGVMTVIKGVKRRATLDKEDVKLVNMAIHECERMKDLIKSLQDFNRPSSGRMAPMNIHATIDSLLLLSKKEYKTKGIKPETNYAADMPQIKAVADQIKQVILNLLNNAAHACEGGGTITINTEVVGKDMTIKIQDTGKGIKPEHMGKILQSQTPRTSKTTPEPSRHAFVCLGQQVPLCRRTGLTWVQPMRSQRKTLDRARAGLSLQKRNRYQILPIKNKKKMT